VERIWLDLAAEFTERGHDVAFVCRRDKAVAAAQHPFALRFISPEQAGERLSRNLLRDLRYSLRAFVRLPPADVTIINCTFLPLLSRAIRGRVIYSVARMPKGQVKAYRRAGVDCLAAVSSTVVDAIVREDPASQPIAVAVPNPIRLAPFQRAASMRRAVPGRIVYAGRIAREKGLEILVDACRRWRTDDDPAVHLRVLGPWAIDRGGSGEDYVAELRARAGDLPIEFVGSVDDRDNYAQELAAGSAFVYPSIAERGETFGVAPLEAMAAGTPTIVSALECFGEFSQPGRNSLSFNHRGEDPAAELLRALRQIPEVANPLSVAGQETAAKFSVPAIASRWEEHFTRLVKGNRA
jgi:glycosyltransferase involved in cell wall biosynthesis